MASIDRAESSKLTDITVFSGPLPIGKSDAITGESRWCKLKSSAIP
jgi:hypothetical protein